MQKYLLAGIGGFLGTVARLWIGTILDDRLGVNFPYGTFVVNLTGCFLMGVILTVLDQKLNANPAWRYFLPIGFIGAYTTFSTFEYEALMYSHNGAWRISLVYVLLSVFLGYACVWIGAMIGSLMA